MDFCLSSRSNSIGIPSTEYYAEIEYDCLLDTGLNTLNVADADTSPDGSANNRRLVH